MPDSSKYQIKIRVGKTKEERIQIESALRSIAREVVVPNDDEWIPAIVEGDRVGRLEIF